MYAYEGKLAEKIMIDLPLPDRLQTIVWQEVDQHLTETGFAHLPGFLSQEECVALLNLYTKPRIFRKTINMAQYRFGQGEYKYFADPLPILVAQLQSSIYPYLVPVANRWMQALHLPDVYPPEHSQLLAMCREKGQLRPTPLLLRYEQGGYNTLHQDLYGDVFFPFQLVAFLNQPQVDYTGGEFVLVEQRPRAQSKAEVLIPNQGDILIFSTNYRPVKRSKGYYRVNMRHGVSRVHSGIRYTLGIIFHNAA